MIRVSLNQNGKFKQGHAGSPSNETDPSGGRRTPKNPHGALFSVPLLTSGGVGGSTVSGGITAAAAALAPGSTDDSSDLRLTSDTVCNPTFT